MAGCRRALKDHLLWLSMVWRFAISVILTCKVWPVQPARQRMARDENCHVWRQKFAACVWSPVPVRKWRSAPRKMLICCLPRVALGALGIYTEIQMQLVARHKLHRRVWFAPYNQLCPMPRNYGAIIVISNFSICPFPAKPCASPIISPRRQIRRACKMKR